MSERLTERVTRFEVQKIPVGWAVTLTAGLGVASAVAGAVASWTGVKPQWTKIGLGVGLGMLPFFTKNLGSQTVNLLSAGLIASGLNTAWQLQEKTESWVDGLLGKVGIPHSSPGVTKSANPGGNGSKENFYVEALGGR